MTQLLGLFGNIESTLKTIILIMVIIGVIFLCYYIKEFRPIVLIILGIFIFAGGIGATVQNIKYFSETNKTIGEVLNSTFHSISYLKQDENVFEIKSPGFKEVSENVYEVEYTIAQTPDFDLQNQKYTLYVNDYRCYSNEQGRDYMISKFNYTFYSNDSTEILTDTLIINFAFNTNSTTVVLRTNGGEQAKELWKAFERKNGIKITFDNSTIDEIYFN